MDRRNFFEFFQARTGDNLLSDQTTLEHLLSTPVSRRKVLKGAAGLLALPVLSSLPGCGYEEDSTLSIDESEDQDNPIGNAPENAVLPNWAISFEGYMRTDRRGWGLPIPLEGVFNSVNSLILEEPGAKSELKIGLAGNNAFQGHPSFYFKLNRGTSIERAIIPDPTHVINGGVDVSNNYRIILGNESVWLLSIGKGYIGSMPGGRFGITIKDMYPL